MTGRRIVIVRHGRTAHNADGRFQGHLDTALDATGRAQAVAVAPVLAGYVPSAIASSDSIRAADSAAPLGVLTGLAVQLDVRLREIDMGHWTGLTRDEVRAAFSAEYADWVAGVDVSRGGGETYKEVADRAEAAARDHLAAVPADGALVLFSHGGTSRALTGRLLELAWDWTWRFSALGNARRIVLAESDRGWRLLEFNA